MAQIETYTIIVAPSTHPGKVTAHSSDGHSLTTSTPLLDGARYWQALGAPSTAAIVRTPTPAASRPPAAPWGYAPDPIPNFTKGKIRIENQRRFSVFLFPTLNSIASTLGGQRSARCQPLLSLKLREKGLSKSRAEKLLIHAAIRAIGKGREKGRLFP